MQAAINAAGNLPAYATCRRRRSTARSIPADTPILTLALTSQDAAAAQGRRPGRHAARAEDFADPGVGLVTHRGGQRPAVRIQANPTALAAYGLTLEDLRTAISNANVNQAKGSFDGPTRASTDRRQRPAQDRPTNIATSSSPTRTARRCGCRDVANVIDGAENTKLPRGRTTRRRSSSTSSASPAPT